MVWAVQQHCIIYLYIYFYWKLEKEPNHCLEVPARGSHTHTYIHTYIHTRINNDTIHTVSLFHCFGQSVSCDAADLIVAVSDENRLLSWRQS